MTQDERWLKRYQDVMEFMDKNPRNPSRPRIEEQEKKMNAGVLWETRLAMFKELMELNEQYRRKNQYQ